MAEISGVEGSITAGGAALEASEWSADLDTAVIDRSNFTTAGEPVNARGQNTGTITASGPASTTTNLAGKGITRGALVTFVLRMTANVAVTVQGRVSKISYSNSSSDGPKWTVNAAQYGAPSFVGI